MPEIPLQPRRIRPAAAAAPRPTVAVGRVTLAAAMAVTALLAIWAGAATWYIASRDEIAQRLFVRETEMQLAYEDRIGRLSGHLEREVTQNSVDRNAVEARIGALAARQTQIEARQAWLRGAAERVSGGSAAAPAPGFAFDAPALPPSRPEEAKPAPIADGAGLQRPDAKPVLRDRLSALEAATDRVAAEETALVAAFGRVARSHVSRLRSAIDATGIDVPARPAPGIGGPFVALPPGAASGAGGFGLADLDLSFSELSRLQAAARTLPLGAPLAGELEPTSPFGYRVDPFTRGPALHTGLDFRAETGTPARATAAGRVVSAEYSGGYGLMVEVDHGGGVTTRYGHLSAFAVVPGERVEAGQIVGRAGSTGRSTGSHLHYETRVNGEPVNPVRFLEAGRLLHRG